MHNLFKQFQQRRLKKRLKKERVSRKKFLKELQNPGSTRTRHSVGPPL